jgi:hypothetical protein
MYLPVQSQPVQRSIVGGPSASQSGMPGGEWPGVEPSGLFDWVKKFVGNPTVQTIAKTAAPYLGAALGI